MCRDIGCTDKIWNRFNPWKNIRFKHTVEYFEYFIFFLFFFCDIIEALKLKSTDKCIKMGTLDHFKNNFSDNNLILLFLLHYIYPITYYILILLQKIIFPIFYVSLYFIILSIYFEFQSRKNLIDSD